MENKISENNTKKDTKTSSELIKKILGVFNQSNAPWIALGAFAIFLSLSIFAMVQVAERSIVTACSLLVLSSFMAVCLSRASYLGIGVAALLQLAAGIFTNQVPAVIISIIIYFGAVCVIHIFHSCKAGVEHETM